MHDCRVHTHNLKSSLPFLTVFVPTNICLFKQFFRTRRAILIVLDLGSWEFCVFIRDSVFVLRVTCSYFVFCVFPLGCCLVVSTNAIDYLEILVWEMTHYVSSG